MYASQILQLNEEPYEFIHFKFVMVFMGVCESGCENHLQTYVFMYIYIIGTKLLNVSMFSILENPFFTC